MFRTTNQLDINKIIQEVRLPFQQISLVFVKVCEAYDTGRSSTLGEL